MLGGRGAWGLLDLDSLKQLLLHEVEPGEIGPNAHVRLEKKQPCHEHVLSALLEKRPPLRKSRKVVQVDRALASDERNDLLAASLSQEQKLDGEVVPQRARLVGRREQQPVVEIMPSARGDAIDLPTRPPALHLLGALDKPGAFEPVQRPIELPVVQAPEVAVEGLELDLELIPVSSFGPRRDQPQERILNHVRRQSTLQSGRVSDAEGTRTTDAWSSIAKPDRPGTGGREYAGSMSGAHRGNPDSE